MKHGMTGTRIYKIWCKMKERCYNSHHNSYIYYGGRGITVCAEWLNNFQAFYDWAMANGYADNLTLDRIDSNGNYEPSNCRWATTAEQSNNKRNSQYITHNGKTQTKAQWAKEIGTDKTVIEKRLKVSKMSADEALTKPIRHPHKITYNGETKSLPQWAEHTGIKYKTLYKRIYISGWNIERALTTK